MDGGGRLAHPGFRDRLSWYAGISSYWFATSFKWFILLVAILPEQVKALVPEGTKNASWGMVLAIGSVWAMIGPALFGYLSDRTRSRFGRRRPYIALGAALTVVAVTVLAGAPSLAWLVVGYLLLQVSDDIGTGPFGGLIPELVPEERRGTASGVLSSLQLLAQIASAVAGLVLNSVELIYAGIALVNVVCAVTAIWTLRGSADPPGGALAVPAPSLSGFVKGWLEPWRSRDFVWVWFTRFLNAFAFYLVQPYLLNYLEDMIAAPVGEGMAGARYSAFGFSVAKAGEAAIVLAIVISLFGAIGSFFAARMADRVGRKRVIYVAGMIMAGVLVPFAFVRDFGSILLLGMGFGVGYGMYLSADWALAADVMPNPDALAKDMGVWVMSVSSVQLISGLFGSVIDAGNAYSMGYGYMGAILLASASFLASTVLVRQVKGSR